MKKFLVLLSIYVLTGYGKVLAQYSGSFIVQGDLGKYYPVIFSDASWGNNKATVFDIGRSNVHTDANWRGSLIAKFRVHTTDWGHGSNFIDASIRQNDPINGKNFIAGWTDGTSTNGGQTVIIWLQGGSNTYYYNSAVNINPVVYDGVQNALPYQEINGPARTYKTGIDSYVNSNGENIGGSAYFNGGGDNYFAGYVGIGTTDPDQPLTVNGTIHAKQVNVDVNIPVPDYVFEKNYPLKPLAEVKKYVDANKHLPEMPAAAVIEKNGINVTELNIQMLKKIEELTLYLIERDKKDKEKNKLLKFQQKQINLLTKQVEFLSGKIK